MNRDNLLIVLFVFSLVFLVSCEKEVGENKTNISSANENESHNMGKNCMDCHISGGRGDGWFNVAGTAYMANKMTYAENVVVKLYSGANGSGDLVATVYGDKKGNFYTTENIDFGTGLYPIIISSEGVSRNMISSITNGACNSCHNVTTDKIWIE